MEENILHNVRSFNRFITAKLNVFNRFALETSYSLTEGRIIGEVGRNEGCSANSLGESINMDKSYLSRILAKLETEGLVRRTVSQTDSRKKQLFLTLKGGELFQELETLSNNQAKSMLSGLSSEQIAQLLESMYFIQTVLEEK